MPHYFHLASERSALLRMPVPVGRPSRGWGLSVRRGMRGSAALLGTRHPEKLRAWVSGDGKGASTGTFSDAIQFAELAVLAVFGLASQDAIQIAGVDNFKGKVVLDATNPLDKSGGLPPKLVGSLGNSGGELNQRALPDAFIVKAFNTVGAAHFYKPEFPGGPPDMFLCGDNEKAKEQVSRICSAFGWNPIDVGGIALSHYIEATSMLWTIPRSMAGTGTRRSSCCESKSIAPNQRW
jgi:predicted dinucleotide-binding enzyme